MQELRNISDGSNVPPVFLLVDLFCLQKTGNTFDFSEICHVVGVFELVLIAEADLVYHVIKSFDDVEGVDTNFGIGEVISRPMQESY